MAVKLVVAALFLAAGSINLYPVVGVISPASLEKLYGLDLSDQGDLLILMRHRAVLFGLLGALIVGSAFRPSLRPMAGAGGLISMLAFVLLAWLQGAYGEAVRKIVIADLIASAALMAALVLARLQGPPRT